SSASPRQHPPSKVSDPNSPEAAANGQFILIRREAYDAIGGHAAVANEILEDVALARRVKASGRKLRFRYAADAVRTRMYRNFQQLREGWTKNLALLFPNPGWLAARIVLWWLFSWTAFAIGATGLLSGYWRVAYYLLIVAFLYRRIARANFRAFANLMSTFFGMPMFAYLLLRSRHLHGKGSVSWKGRTYSNSDDSRTKSASNPTNHELMKT